MGGALAAAAISKAQRQVVSHFLSRNAVSAGEAVPYEPQRRLERRYFEQLRGKGVIVPTTRGTYWIDVPKLEAHRATLRKRSLVIVAVMVVVVIVGVVLARGG